MTVQVAADMTTVDLGYVNEVLQVWLDNQCKPPINDVFQGSRESLPLHQKQKVMMTKEEVVCRRLTNISIMC